MGKVVVEYNHSSVKESYGLAVPYTRTDERTKTVAYRTSLKPTVFPFLYGRGNVPTKNGNPLSRGIFSYFFYVLQTHTKISK